MSEALPLPSGPFEPRHLGDYLLVAQLGHDALGTVYRALHSGDERRFVRLRVLQSGELSPEAVVSVVARNMERGTPLFNQAIVRRPQFGIVDGIPFMAWYETAGWTLDTVLAKTRAVKCPIPVEYALLIAERVGAALEHAHVTIVDGRPTTHGLLWPGFVSVSNDADVRVGGFGLAPAVVGSLLKPRLARDIAPYVAPEARALGLVGSNSDVYSLGVLLLELLTGRRPVLSPPFAELRAGDPFSREISAFLRCALGPPSERFPSAVEMHRGLEELLTGSPYLVSSASLALFLYQLLNPESQTVRVSAAEGESTNPIPGGPPPATVEAPVSVPPEPLRVPAQASASPLAEELAEMKAWGIESQRRTKGSSLEGIAVPPTKPMGLRTVLSGVGGAVVLVVIALAIALLTQARPPAAPDQPTVAAVAASAPAVLPPQAPEVAAPLLASEPAGSVVSSAGDAADVPAVNSQAATEKPVSLGGVSHRRRINPLRPSQARGRPVVVSAQARRPAEDARFQAAFARIRAERLDAGELASDLFGQGRQAEQEATHLLRQGSYDDAHSSFQRAADLFREAEEASRQERVRRVQLVSPSSTP